jgi:hypothetical protein
MIVGDKGRFAIEAEPAEWEGDWLFGRFRFWLCGQPVGNWEDSVDLKGCLRSLRDFATNPRNRCEPGLASAPPEVVFRIAYDSVMAGARDRGLRETIPNTVARFHISHIGMSSFDRFDLLLVKDPHGGERCLWREAGSEIRECRLWRNEMEQVALEFCTMFDSEVGRKTD